MISRKWFSAEFCFSSSNPKLVELASCPAVLFSHSVRLFVTPRTATHQTSLSLTISRSSPKFISIELPSNHLILCCPLHLPSIFPSIRVFSNESALQVRGPKYQSFSFSISWAQLQKPKCLSDSKPLFWPSAFPKVLSGRSAFHWLNNHSEISLSRAGSLKM